MKLTSEVLLCSYNGSAFVVEQLESILNQSHRVNKISIYDDHSEDGTVPLIQDFVRRRPEHEQRLFTIHINPTNLGYARNFIGAIENATEDVLFLCDQDDIWEAHKVQRLLELLQETGPDMVFSDGRIIDASGRPYGRSTVLHSYGLREHQIRRFRECSFELLLKRNYINGAAAAVRRTAALRALPLPCDMPHDYWLAIWCALHDGIVATPDPLYRYRSHGRNVIGLGSDRPLYRWLGIWKHPTAPRERELRIWRAVTSRIAALPRATEIEAAQRKLAWLFHVVPKDKNSFKRAFEILKSALTGKYRSYSVGDSFFRDLVSLIR
jgi:glycosyltransferase involved in cell wall biosynthesis